MKQQLIPNLGMKSRFYRLARAGGLCLYSPTLEGAGVCRPLKTRLGIIRTVILFMIMAISLMGIQPAMAGNSGDGAKLFTVHCAGCHANGGNIIRRGKTLKLKALAKNHRDTQEAIAQLITQGKNPMPAYNDRLSVPEIEAVAAYVLEQAEIGWK